MNPLQYLKTISATMTELSRRTGHPVWRMYASFLRSYLCRHASVFDFQNLQLYKYSPLGQSGFLTFRQQMRLIRKVNHIQDLHSFDDKRNFHRLFSDFIHRDWLYLPDASEAEILAFLSRTPKFLLKPTHECQGSGILLFHREELDPPAFLAQYAGKEFLMEAYIVQHPDMAALNPSSVNTVRIVSVRRDKEVLLLGAGLRCGGQDSYVDNFHNGGSAYPIDLETGMIPGPGQSLAGGTPLLYSPTGHIMPGFVIPHWDILKDSVRRAALIPEGVGYIGWDVAITEEGVEFVEFNVGAIGTTITQLSDEHMGTTLQNFLRDK